MKIVNWKLKTEEHGVSLYIAFMIMTTLMGIAFGASTLLFSQLGILKGMGRSVFAFYAMDAGVERALYIANTNTQQGCLNDEDPVLCLQSKLPTELIFLVNGASYQIKAESPGEAGCPDNLGYNYCVRAEGIYEEARRAVRVAR